jgi:sRNA-binding protein
MRFEFAVASRATKRARVKSEMRRRCDSKEKKKDRIRRRSKERKDRIRRCSRKRKNRIRRRSKKEKNDRIRRRCRRRLEDATNDSKFESLIRLRTNSTSTTMIAYLINVAKHKKRILYESFLRLHLLSSKL